MEGYIISENEIENDNEVEQLGSTELAQKLRNQKKLIKVALLVTFLLFAFFALSSASVYRFIYEPSIFNNTFLVQTTCHIISATTIPLKECAIYCDYDEYNLGYSCYDQQLIVEFDRKPPIDYNLFFVPYSIDLGITNSSTNPYYLLENITCYYNKCETNMYIENITDVCEKTNLPELIYLQLFSTNLSAYYYSITGGVLTGLTVVGMIALGIVWIRISSKIKKIMVIEIELNQNENQNQTELAE